MFSKAESYEIRSEESSRSSPRNFFLVLFFFCILHRFFSNLFSTLDVEVIIYKAGCVVEVRNGELRKVELDSFYASMKPGETVVERNCLFLVVCATLIFSIFV